MNYQHRESLLGFIAELLLGKKIVKIQPGSDSLFRKCQKSTRRKLNPHNQNSEWIQTNKSKSTFTTILNMCLKH